jgi:hypothetical protein
VTIGAGATGELSIGDCESIVSGVAAGSGGGEASGAELAINSPAAVLDRSTELTGVPAVAASPT